MSSSASTLDVDTILAPIAGPRPAGIDTRYLDTYDKIRGARKEAVKRQEGTAGLENAEDGLSPEERAMSAGDDWLDVQRLTVNALMRESKDLQIAAWLLEAETFLSGFAGATKVFEIIRGLIENFWDDLFPSIDSEDDQPLALRAAPLRWVDERLPGILAGLPLTSGPRRYPLALLHLAERATDDHAKKELAAAGRPGAEQFAQAMAASGVPYLETMANAISACLTALAHLQESANARFGAAAGDGELAATVRMVSLSDVRKILEECEFQVARALRTKRGGQKSPPGPDPEKIDPSNPDPFRVTGDGTWDRALQLVLQGQLEGLRIAQGHIQAAISGRERFLRQLQLSELCVRVGMEAFAYPILDELGKTVDKRELVTWEDPEVIRRTWSALASACGPLARMWPETVARHAEAQQRLDALASQMPAVEGAGA
jgi:type VI secretion system protein ImpA